MAARRTFSHAERIASLIDRAKLATLTWERAANPRVNKAMYYLEMARREGQDLDAVLDEALKSYWDAPKHAALVRSALTRNFNGANRRKCFEGTEWESMRRGKAPTIQKGDFAGEKLEVDHLLPIARAPYLGNEIANLCYLPRKLNRRKKASLSKAYRTLSGYLLEAGVISAVQFAELCPPEPKPEPGNLPEAPAPSSPAGAPSTVPANGAGAVPTGNGAIPRPERESPLSVVPLSFASSGDGVFTDPRIILARVPLLTGMMEDWERRSGAALERGNFAIAHSREQLEQITTLATKAAYRAEEVSQRVSRFEEDLGRYQQYTANAKQRVAEAAHEAKVALNVASRTVNHWRGELSSAQSWLRDARDRENQAIAHLDYCQSALSSAESALRSAERELREARSRMEYAGTDSQGKAQYRPADTSGYEREVDNARQEVYRWESAVSAARQELDSARRNREAAERRVSACEDAVGLSEQGEECARTALQAAEQADSVADHAIEETNLVSKTTVQARRAADREEEAARQMEREVGQASTLQAAAGSYLELAKRQQNDARQRSTLGRFEIEGRLDFLRAFDAPITFPNV